MMVQNKKNLLRRNKFQIPGLTNTNMTEQSISNFSGTCVCAEGTSFLPVAVDEGDPVGRNDDDKQSRPRLLFGSGPT
jgi:hypothetical protein